MSILRGSQFWGTTRGTFNLVSACPLWWVMISNEDMGVCVGQIWRHGCVLRRCWPAMKTWLLVGRMRRISGNMGVCWVGADQQWRHGCVCVCVATLVLAGACSPGMETIVQLMFVCQTWSHRWLLEYAEQPWSWMSHNFWRS